VSSFFELFPIAVLNSCSNKYFSCLFCLCLAKGDKIHASILTPNVGQFVGKLVENAVYQVSSFSVARSHGAYRTALHSYRIVFDDGTSVCESDSDNIPLFGLTLTTFKEFYSHRIDCDFLIGWFCSLRCA
jgi:hypothetical protein